MEVKKSPKADLQNKRSLFLQIGIVLSLAVIIGLFSWSQKEKVIEQIDLGGDIAEQEMIEITVQEEKPQEPVKRQQMMISEIIKIVKDDSKIEADFSIFDEFTDLGEIEVKTFTKPDEEVDEDIPVMTAEEMPTFQGKDINAFRAWCQGNAVYPAMAQENGVQGRVVVSFVVERDGSVSNVKVLRGQDRDLDAAAIKVVSQSPKWAPGKNRGKPVRFTYNMPIDFVLQN